ncbi:MAG: DUF2933 domain-containing protein [Actinobacteria bacterium]|nr:DUF2933 domain-containing protein [Actinomycetota bacterium]
MKAFLPLLFVLVCPLMMVFMMRGMHGHGADAHKGDGAPGEETMTASQLRELRENLEAQMDVLNQRINSMEDAAVGLVRDETQNRVEEREVLTR